MNVSNISFNAETPRNTSTAFRAKRPIRPALVAASHSLGEPSCTTYKAYEFAEYEIARRTVREKSQLDDAAGRNALWALGQLEGITYAPGVVPNPDGSFSLEWRTDKGFGSLKIGATYSTYQLYPQTSEALEGNGAETSERCVGLLVNTLLYPSMAPSIHWAEPNVSAQMPICGHFVSDRAIAIEPRTETTDKLTALLVQAFASAKLLDFEDGRENQFTLEIARLVKRFGVRAVEEIGRIIDQPRVSRDIGAQALLCLGRVEDGGTYAARSQVARQNLRSSSALIRDAAAVAIDSMADRDAANDLRLAIARESVPSLKGDMQSVLLYLETLG